MCYSELIGKSLHATGDLSDSNKKSVVITKEYLMRTRSKKRIKVLVLIMVLISIVTSVCVLDMHLHADVYQQSNERGIK